MSSLSQSRRLMEQDRPMRLAFNNWYTASKQARDYTPLMIFEEGFSAALTERKICIEKVSMNVVVSAYHEYCKPYGKEWRPNIEELYASGWEIGKRLQ